MKTLRSTSAAGSPLALSLKFQFNVRGRYEKEMSSGLRPFIQGTLHHFGKSNSSDISNVDIRYQGSNASVGFITDEPNGENLSDARPQLYVNGNDGTNRITTSRPRMVGLRVSTKI